LLKGETARKRLGLPFLGYLLLFFCSIAW
jgi:hypothetical protein